MVDFSDLIPKQGGASAGGGGLFDDLVPQQTQATSAGFAPRAAREQEYSPEQLREARKEMYRGDIERNRSEANSMGGRMGTAWRSFVGMVPFADDAVAALAATVPSDLDYSGSWSDRFGKARDYVEAQHDVDWQKNPGAYIAGSGASLLASPGGQFIAGAKSLPSLMGRSAAVGGAYGAAGGASSNGSVDERASAALQGGALGMLVGGAAPAATRALGAGFNTVAGPFIQRARERINPNTVADDMVAKSFMADHAAGRTISKAELAAAQANGQPLVLGDIGGETARGLARAATNTSPIASGIINDVVDPRFHTQSDRLGSFVANLFDYPDPTRMRDTIQQVARRTNDRAYRQVYGEFPKIETPELRSLINDSPIIGDMAKKVLRENPNLMKAGMSKDMSNPSLEFWDRLQRQLRQAAESAKSSNLREDAAMYQSLRTQLLGELDAATKGRFQQVRQGAAQFFDAEDAVEAGQKFFSQNGLNDLGAARKALESMSEAERRNFAQGFAAEMAHKATGTGDNKNVAIQSWLNNPNARAKMELALGKDRADQISTFVNVESAMNRLRAATQGNSSTVRQLIDSGIFGVNLGNAVSSGVIGAGVNLATGDEPLSMKGLAVGAARALVARNGGLDPKTAELIARRFVSNDPKVVGKVIDMAMRKDSTRKLLLGIESELTKMAAQLGGQIERERPKGYAGGGEVAAEQAYALPDQRALDDAALPEIDPLGPEKRLASGVVEGVGTAGRYLRDRSLKDMAGDVGRFGSAMWEHAKSDPVGTVLDFTPVIGEIRSGMDAVELDKKAEEAERAGDDKAASTYRQLSALAAAGAIPAAGIGARAAKRAGKVGAKELVEGAERTAVDAAGTAPDVAKVAEDLRLPPPVSSPLDEAAARFGEVLPPEQAPRALSGMEEARPVSAIDEALPPPREPAIPSQEPTPAPIGDIPSTTSPPASTELPGVKLRQDLQNMMEQSLAETGHPRVPTRYGLGVQYLAPATQPVRDGDPLFLTSTTNANARRQIANIDPLLQAYPNAALDPEQWVNMTAQAFNATKARGSNAENLGLIPPWGLIKGVKEGTFENMIRNMTPGQVADRQHGLNNLGRQFFDAYTTGRMGVEDTGKLFGWGIFSRGVNPFTQEGLSIDTFFGIEPFIKMAAEGNFTQDVYQNQFKKWVKTVAPKGSGQPGAGASHNLNAFGRDFLMKMGAPGENGVTPLQRIHDLMSDPSMSGRDIRRAFAEIGEGVGIDNKVMSFLLLVTGRPDVLVLDRIQLGNLWDDGRFAGFNLWDGVTAPRVAHPDTGVKSTFPPTPAGRKQAEELASKLDSKVEMEPLTGTSLAEATYGARGLLIYEAVENSLLPHIKDMYARAGRPAEDATLGGWHWDTWVAKSDQEASHGTLEAILRKAQGHPDPLSGIYSRQGDYQTYAYGARYGMENGRPGMRMADSQGRDFRFEMPDFQRFQELIKKPSYGVVPGDFKVTDTKGGPWHARPEVNNAARDELIARFGEPVTDGRSAAADGANAAANRAGQADQFARQFRVGQLVRDAVSFGGHGSGLPAAYARRTGALARELLTSSPPAFNASVKAVYEAAPEAASVFEKASISSPPVYELTPGTKAALAFRDAIERSKVGNPYGAAVHVYEPGEYAQMRLFLTPDGTAGAALKGDDIVSVFNTTKGPHKGVANALLALAIQQGGRKLDAFDTVLPGLYSRLGMRVESRMKWDDKHAPKGWDKKTFAAFNNGEPDVVFMRYDPRRIDFYKPGEGTLFDDYDKAVRLQTKGVKKSADAIEAIRRAADRKKAVPVKKAGGGYVVPSSDRDLHAFVSATLPLAPRRFAMGGPAFSAAVEPRITALSRPKKGALSTLRQR